MRFYNLTVEFDKQSISEAEINEIYDNPIREWLSGAVGPNPGGFIDMVATVEASSFAAAVVTMLDRVAEMTSWPVRSVEIMTTRDFDTKWALDELPWSLEPKKSWVRRLLTRG